MTKVSFYLSPFSSIIMNNIIIQVFTFSLEGLHGRGPGLSEVLHKIDDNVCKLLLT